MELWENIPFYEGIYQISNYGNVRSLDREVKRAFHKNGVMRTLKVKGQKIKGTPNNQGYLRVSLVNLGKNKKKFFIHRLVGNAFLSKKREDQKWINHKDGIKSNNHHSNLEWVNCQENSIHSINNKLQIPLKGESNPFSKLTQIEVDEIRLRHSKGESIPSMHNDYSVSKTMLYNIVNRKFWTKS